MARVLITTDYLKPDDDVDRLLRRHGHHTVHLPHTGPRPAQEQALLLQDVDAAILASEPVTSEMLERADRLKVLARSGVGYDSIDVSAVSARGVQVCNAPGTNHHSVAELTLGLMLASARQIPQVSAAVREGSWPRDAGRELRGRRLGVIGYGPSGRAVTQLGTALGMHVQVTTAHPDSSAAAAFVGLEENLRTADVLTLHTQAQIGAGPLLDAGRLALMQPTAMLINTARGSLVDEQALAAALRSGVLSSAALDVLEAEPLPQDSPLRGLDNVIITSHLAGQTAEARRRAGLSAAQAVLDVLEGREPEHPVGR